MRHGTCPTYLMRRPALTLPLILIVARIHQPTPNPNRSTSPSTDLPLIRCCAAQRRASMRGSSYPRSGVVD